MKVIVFAISLLLPALACAEVDILNGNYFVTYQDIRQNSDDHTLNLRRTYNSFASEKGWFGYGWGSTYETQLIVMPDGTAAVQENGAGSVFFYRSLERPDVALTDAKLVDTATKRGKLSPEAARTLAGSLYASDTLRVSKSRELGVQADLPLGTTLFSNTCRGSGVERTPNGFERITCNGSIEKFDLAGHLVGIDLGGGHRAEITYKDGFPVNVREASGLTIDFEHDASGHVTAATAGTVRNRYTYNARGELASVETPASGRVVMSYDDNHNLTRFTMSDTSTHSIAYMSGNGMVREVIERNGAKSSYEYNRDSATGKLISTNVIKHGINPGAYLSGKYTLQNRYDGLGRLVHTERYEEDNQNNQTIDYVYDARNRLIRNTTYLKENSVTIDMKLNETRKTTERRWIIDLSYDTADNVAKILQTFPDNDTYNEVSFRYDNQHHAVQWQVAGIGVVNVTHDGKKGPVITPGQDDNVVQKVVYVISNLMNQIIATSL